MEERSPDDQKERKSLDKKALLAPIILLSLPAAIPLLFLSQAESTSNRLMLIGMSVIVALANALLLRVLMRWFKSLQRDE